AGHLPKHCSEKSLALFYPAWCAWGWERDTATRSSLALQRNTCSKLRMPLSSRGRGSS
uniref:Uncharacterized protein n=1 Tax=Accipiter nisus TaxID=211598 RepID=A0A8B9MTL4_9AVES